jgi:hypothetical protein
MSLPGFSAQASLRAAVRPYRGRAVFASSATSQAQTIVPSHPACNIWRETQSADLQAAAGATRSLVSFGRNLVSGGGRLCGRG